MGVLKSYRLRLERRRWRARAFRKRRELTSKRNRTQQIGKNDILLFCTLRNERIRLPFFLKYYRDLGVDHFFFVDNGSDDGTGAYLEQQMDVSVFYSQEGYKRARFGVDWLNWLQMRYAHGHWSLTVDVDEFFIYPFCDTRPIRALTDWLDASSIKSFGTMLLDMYPKGPIDSVKYEEGQDPFEVAHWFDSGNYTIQKNSRYGNLWIQGGPRARAFFYENAERAPAMNKIPLVKWNRAYAYVSSTHMLLPRGLNLVYDEWGGEKTSGCLLHAKFLDTFKAKSAEELERKQHFANSHEYKAYNEGMAVNPDLWCQWSEKYINWRQLEILGLMSKGNWA
ncbi:glycosyltransferase family 2 protein [uncultured Litoreibacter sp.]|uniref:glycosyltransferase family 2 protein n=1 Tax=uncultured Litoreibacter sp. TaxID=1392394 RepID=UPI002620DFE2|nr:glycosyltransferase family 2 protein [uncultured Litoreibacter sp.]